MRCDVTTWRLQVNEQRRYRRWAHSLVDPIGRRGNPRPCAVCAHRRAANPPNPLLPPSPLSRDSASLYLSPPFAALLFIRSPFLSYLPFPFPFYARAAPCADNTRTHPHAYSQVETCLHLYLCNDECLRDRSPPGVTLSRSSFLLTKIGRYLLHARHRALYRCWLI